jgi:putative tricarboxylic transport membrane protein
VAAAFAFLKPLTKLTFISGPLLVPFLLLLLALGAYTASNSFADVLVMIVAAAIGVICIRYDWPRVPFLLAVVLGSLAERYLFLSYSIFDWDWLTRPIVLVIGAVMLLTIIGPPVQRRRKRARAKAQADKDQAVSA